MLKEIIFIILLTLLPFLELRYSIPAGLLLGEIKLPLGFSLVGFGLPLWIVFPVVIITNILLGILLYLILDNIINFFLRYKIINSIYKKIIRQSQKKIEKYVDKYGELGVAIFISIPLPGSGVYSGALGAYAIGLSFKKFVIAEIIGVLIAGLAVTLITLGVHIL